MKRGMKKILVLGSTNTDMVITGRKIPAPGETVSGGKFMMNPGGKGAKLAHNAGVMVILNPAPARKLPRSPKGARAPRRSASRRRRRRFRLPALARSRQCPTAMKSTRLRQGYGGQANC